jgi:hypothetical protein
MSSVFRDTEGSRMLRVMFCLGVTPAFFDADVSELEMIGERIKETFADLKGRFGIEVLATMDDDELMVGPSPTWPWTCYILADAPSLEAVTSVTNLLREELGSGRLWKYLKIEARIGRPLFFGTE